ncbi:hypothetical protein P7K49_029877, partial [Saguinus oedipus]
HSQGKYRLAENCPELKTQVTAQASSTSQTGALSAQTRVNTCTNIKKTCKKELPIPQKGELKVGRKIRPDGYHLPKIQQPEFLSQESFAVNTSDRAPLGAAGLAEGKKPSIRKAGLIPPG